MEDAARTIRLRPGASLESARARLVAQGPAAEPHSGADVEYALPDGSRVSFVPLPEARGDHAEAELDPWLRGNAFKPLHDGPRSQSALLSVAAARRVESGPQSERFFVFVRGAGLVFLQNGDTLRFEPGDAAFVPAGESVRVWAQGPDDALAVVHQPRMAPQPQRTLAGEIAKRRQDSPGGSGSV